MTAAKGAKERDLRLDVFRGAALFFIFVDHIPENTLSSFTLGAIGFSDAAEVFIFLSGYAAALVYGSSLARDGFVITAARIWRRVWQLYVAHVFLFVVLSAMVSYTVSTFDNGIYADEMRVGDFLAEPSVALVNALILRFQPTFLDILPLYIVLLGAFPVALVLLTRWPFPGLALSAAIYAAVYLHDLRFLGYPNDQPWFFNPFAWQFLFVVGAVCGLGSGKGDSAIPKWRWLPQAAMAVVAATIVINLSWLLHRHFEPVPALLADLLWPINKTDLSPIRLVTFLALAVTVRHLTPRDARWLAAPLLRPLVLCGKFSLQVFCFGIILSLLGHFVLVEVSGSLAMQIAVTVAGAVAMAALAELIDWFHRVVDARRAARA